MRTAWRRSSSLTTATSSPACWQQAGVDDCDPAEFRRYGSARRLYNFDIDHAGEY